MKKITLYVVGHKPFELPAECDAIYHPIYVGNGISYGKAKSFLSDDIGSNISKKNANYCEMTAYYWIWKNDLDSEIVGVLHYRRYFKNERILTASDIENSVILQTDNAVILPKPITWKKDSVYLAYLRGGGYKKDIEHVIKIIDKIYPEYMPALNKVLNGHKASYCNMIICRKTFFDGYCKWIFRILGEMEDQTDMTGYTKEEQRVYGYLAEILLNVYCEHNECQKEEKNLFMPENESSSKKKRKEILYFAKEIIKHAIWFPSGIKPARRKLGV